LVALFLAQQTGGTVVVAKIAPCLATDIPTRSRGLLRYGCPAARSLLRQATSAKEEASDMTLIERISAHDQRAMQTLYERHHVRIYRFVVRLIGDVHLAEDVVSEVFLAVWRQAKEFQARSEGTTWIIAIARNIALSGSRWRRHETLDEAANLVTDPEDNADVLFGKKERSSIVRACLAQLSPVHREVIDLVYYHEKSVTEVARIVGACPNTVKTRMFYARKQLAALIDEEAL
jgi:RNA polymerase sigma-70 factor (ECF subfamily)